MRNKIDYGIDLGTTNSAISRMEGGKPVIKKSDTLKDTTPSCVSVNKRGDFLAGDTAFNMLKTDNARALKSTNQNSSNSFIEFKRTMGTTHTYFSSNLDRPLTSEQLSAEILKKLKSYIIDENINSIVITVPAKFLNPQKEATLQAAKLAGFKHVELLQEPVAAATAYGLHSTVKNGYWLVFDFGGGTFDAALLKADEGILTVKDTEGDNWLGGKNLDNAIVDEIILPYLKDNYSIDQVLSDAKKLQVLRDAVKPYAEEAKNQLSFKDSYNILSNLGDLPFEDENGEEPEIDITISRSDLEKVLSPIFQKAIDITLSLLKRNNLTGKEIDALILVGGPTYSPILREMLKKQVTDKVDTSIDPMTAVANGAALFASTISISDEVLDESRDNTKLQLEINYEATTVDLEEMINISVLKDKCEGILPSEIYAVVNRSDGAWSSTKKLISEKKALIDVLLNENESNQFEIVTYDNAGNKIECEPDTFIITQGFNIGQATLPYNICIVKYFQDEEKDLISTVKGLEKNNRLPAIGVRNGLKTRNQIRPGNANDIIRIPIYQGDYNSEMSNPLLNDEVCEIIITGETIPKLLPIGSDVDITIKVDRSETMKFSAYFPAIEHTEELDVKVTSKEPPSSEFLKHEISASLRKAKKFELKSVEENLTSLENKLQNEGASADGKLEILEGLRKELIIIDESENKAEWPVLEQELKDTFYEFEDLVEKIKNIDQDQISVEKLNGLVSDFRNKIEQVITTQDRKSAKELNSAINMFDFELRNKVSGNGVDIQYLQMINEKFNDYTWQDPNKARQLINQGLQMVADGRSSGVREVLIQLFSLMPKDEIPETLA